MHKLILVALLWAGAVIYAGQIPAGYKLLYEQSCADVAALKDFVFSDPAAWAVTRDSNNVPSLELRSQSKYTPKDRSPFNIAIVANQVFGDFVLEAELASTVKPYPHQDMCLFFGCVDSNKFYYAHLGLKRDALAHNVTIVNDAPRAVIPTQANDGVAWGQNEWHKVRLERRASDGSIKVYFDDAREPVMQANDRTFPHGYVGFGSFDDLGRIRNIKIYGPSSETRRANFFKPPQPQ